MQRATLFPSLRKHPKSVSRDVYKRQPNSMHYEVCKAALEAGLHVVCEKPLCFTSAEAGELVRLAEEKKRVVGVTYGYSGHQLIQQARQMIKNGDLGEIRIINMSFAFGGYNVKIEETNPAAKWRFDPKKAGPSFALGDVGTHPLFIIEAMMPDILSFYWLLWPQRQPFSRYSVGLTPVCRLNALQKYW